MAKYLDKEKNIIYNFPANHFEDQRDVKPIKIKYRNWKGEIGVRTIFPDETWFGFTEFHPTPQFLMKAWDVDKQAFRDFALMDIIEFIKE